MVSVKLVMKKQDGSIERNKFLVRMERNKNSFY